MRDIKAIIEGIVSQGRQVGSGGAAFRSASSSGSSGKHDHGVDIGAHRNQAHELRAKDAAADRAKAREKEVAKRNKEAEKRSKKVSGMANEESVSEGTYSKHDTDHLKQMHARDSGVISRYKGKMGSGISDVIDREHDVRKELSKRGHKVDRPKHSLVIEDKMSAGTEARVKIKNVARPDDPAPTSEKSTLSKTGQIKTKIIDEEKPLMSDRNFGLPAGLIAAARQIIEKKDDVKLSGGKTQVELEPETDDKVDESDSKKKHTVPKTDKEKKLAALATPKDKITHKDVLVGRGVVKEASPASAGAAAAKADDDEREKLKAAGKKIPSRLTGMKEDVEQVDEATKSGNASWRIPAHVKKHLEDKHGTAQSIHVSSDGSKITHSVRHLDDDGMDHYETRTHEYNGKDPVKDRKVGKLIKHVKPKMDEEVEQVDEVSKATLGSYITKVASLPPEKVKPSREKGIETASKKIHKEEVEQVDEVSKATLGSYVKKASDDATKHSYMAAKTGNLDTAAKASKRIRGIAKATDKLTKESFSQEELDRLEEIAKKFD